MKDESTQNLIKGLNFLLALYPKAKVRIGFSREELHVKGMEDDLVPETKKILEDWNWSLNFYEEIYYWELELQGTINDK